MFKRILVGVNDGDGGRDAIALAKLLLTDGGELTLAHIYQGDARLWRGASADYDAAEYERARELLQAARTDSGVEAHLRWRGSPSAGRGLHELAEHIGAHLVVVGSSRRGLLGRVLLGDDTRAALNGAPCAVAIAPAGYSRHPVLMREIGIGYDGSPESEHALRVARGLAAEHRAKLSAFEAVSVPSGALTVPIPDGDWLESVVESAHERVAALDDVEPHAVYGQAAEELAVFSASLDLLVVGSRGYGPLGRLVHGSTSQQLARTARCPLLVMTRAARAAETSEVSNGDLDGAVEART
jgi:nucleotide-binding universal stress UspA family protein